MTILLRLDFYYLTTRCRKKYAPRCYYEQNSVTTEMLLEWIFWRRFIDTERFLDETGGCYNLKQNYFIVIGIL